MHENVRDSIKNNNYFLDFSFCYQMASLIKSMIVRILICLEISLFITSTMADFTEFGRGSTKKFCGKMLTESLALICNNEYETIIHQKRSGKRLKSLLKFSLNNKYISYFIA